MLVDLLVAMVESALILTVAYAPVSLRNFVSKPRAGAEFHAASPPLLRIPVVAKPAAHRIDEAQRPRLNARS